MIVSPDATSRMPLPAEPVLAADRPPVEVVEAPTRADTNAEPAASPAASPAAEPSKAEAKASKPQATKAEAKASEPQATKAEAKASEPEASEPEAEASEPEAKASEPKTTKPESTRPESTDRKDPLDTAGSERAPAAQVPRVERMAVRPHDGGWQLSVAGVDAPAWVVDTKARAVEAAREAAAFHRCPLDVHGKDGARQRTVQPPNQA